MNIEEIRGIFESANVKIENTSLAIFYPREEVTDSDSISGNSKDILYNLLLHTNGITVRHELSKAWSVIFEISAGFLSGDSGAFMRKKTKEVFTDEEAWAEIDKLAAGIPREARQKSLDVFWDNFSGADFEDTEDVKNRTSRWFSDLRKAKPRHSIDFSKLSKWEILKGKAREFYSRFPRFELEVLDPDESDDTASLIFGIHGQRDFAIIDYSKTQVLHIAEMVDIADRILLEPTESSFEISLGIDLTT